jgi:hypothetical protein
VKYLAKVKLAKSKDESWVKSVTMREKLKFKRKRPNKSLNKVNQAEKPLSMDNSKGKP